MDHVEQMADGREKYRFRSSCGIVKERSTTRYTVYMWVCVILQFICIDPVGPFFPLGDHTGTGWLFDVSSHPNSGTPRMLTQASESTYGSIDGPMSSKSWESKKQHSALD